MQPGACSVASSTGYYGSRTIPRKKLHCASRRRRCRLSSGEYRVCWSDNGARIDVVVNETRGEDRWMACRWWSARVSRADVVSLSALTRRTRRESWLPVGRLSWWWFIAKIMDGRGGSSLNRDVCLIGIEDPAGSNNSVLTIGSRGFTGWGYGWILGLAVWLREDRR